MINTNPRSLSTSVPRSEVIAQAWIPIPWFDQSDYKELRALFSDGSRLPETFGAWHAQATDAFRVFQDQGLRVTRVRLRPKEFEIWCQEHRFSCDYRARHSFAQELISRVSTGDRGSWLSSG